MLPQHEEKDHADHDEQEKEQKQQRRPTRPRPGDSRFDARSTMPILQESLTDVLFAIPLAAARPDVARQPVVPRRLHHRLFHAPPSI